MGFALNLWCFLDRSLTVKADTWRPFWLDWAWAFEFWIEWPKIKLSIPSKTYFALKAMSCALLFFDIVSNLSDFALGLLAKLGKFVYLPPQPYLWIIQKLVPRVT